MSSSRWLALSSERMPSEALRTAMRLLLSGSRARSATPRLAHRDAWGGPGHAHRRHRRDRQRRHERGRRAGARRARDARSSASRAGGPRLRARAPRWVAADVAADAARATLFRGRRRGHPPRLADPAVARRGAMLEAVNVDGTRRVFEAAAAAGARRARARLLGRRLLARARRTARVDESWPTERHRRPRSTRATRPRPSGCSTRVEAAHPELRVVRLRPALIFKREAASGIRRLFAGPLLPSPLVRPGAAAACCRCRPGCASRPCTPTTSREAYRLAATDDARARRLQRRRRAGARRPRRSAARSARGPCACPCRRARRCATSSWRLRLQPTPPGWLDMGMAVPLMDSTRASATSSAGRRATAPTTRCSSCWPGCATARRRADAAAGPARRRVPARGGELVTGVGVAARR